MLTHRLIARTGLTVALLIITTCMLILARPAFTGGHPSAEIGKTAPQFTLPTTDGQIIALTHSQGHPTLLFFGSDACSVSKRYSQQLLTLAQAHPDVTILAINSNTAAHAPDASNLALCSNSSIPTLLDPLAEVAHSYGATVTPTFCIIDSDGILRYAGSFDDGVANPRPAGQYVAQALAKIVDGVPCEITSTQAFGQTISWVK